MQEEFDFGVERFSERAARPRAVRRQRSASGFQPPLPGCGLARLDSIFFAVLPDASASDQIEHLTSALTARHQLVGKRLGRRRLHVSLHGLGTYEGVPKSLVETASEAASMICAPRFTVQWDRAMSFRGREGNRPFVLRGSSELTALQDFHGELGAALRRTRLWRTVRGSFTPHVTLLYDARLVAEQPVPAVTWEVRDFVLIHSPQGHSRHIELGRWALRD